MALRLLLGLFVSVVAFQVRAAEVTPPQLQDPALQIELIAQEPELVTPTGCCFDDSGRLLVVECHTHFPPADYDGPKVDRIYRFDDSDSDGVLDRKQLFYEGGSATMNVANLGSGWIAVASRSQVVRIRDSDGDGTADQHEVLLKHETKSTYPHNGLGGLTLGSDGWLYVGQGENLGDAYELVARDGSQQQGDGEGGNVFRCTPDGKKLQRVATGFWNPFGLCMDRSQRLWAVENDPDAMPPNRLLHVVPTADYGFQFRFGRAGTHPLLAWNGELPATLPMAAGVGEAACAVVEHEGHLWVTSWGDNRIEKHTLIPHGASWRTQMEVVVQGDEYFRPVNMAAAPDGSIYVTDWVDQSYPVHRKGRLWRISRKDRTAPSSSLPELSEGEKFARALREDAAMPLKQRLDALASEDPFIRQAAIAGMIQSNQLTSVVQSQATSAQQRVGLLSAWRWSELTTPESLSSHARRDWLEWGLQDSSNEVALIAVRWATERNCKELFAQVRSLLDREQLSSQLFAAVIGSIAYLESGTAAAGRSDPVIEGLLVNLALDAKRPALLRAQAVQRIPAEATAPSDEQLVSLLDTKADRELGREVVWLLAARATPAALDQLRVIVENEALDGETRADAIAALSVQLSEHKEQLAKWSAEDQPVPLRHEATRVLSAVAADIARPAADELDEWMKLIGDAGSVEAGRRVFARKTCASCHTHSGRGSKTGPDLTAVAGQMTRRRVLESILQPSKEVAPQYTPWVVLTVHGTSVTGLKLDGSGVGDKLRFQASDGSMLEIPLADIESQHASPQSIMPAGLEKTMTLDELRDLIAFLTASDAR